MFVFNPRLIILDPSEKLIKKAALRTTYLNPADGDRPFLFRKEPGRSRGIREEEPSIVNEYQPLLSQP